jgi:ankyrin repeat protein
MRRATYRNRVLRTAVAVALGMAAATGAMANSIGPVAPATEATSNGDPTNARSADGSTPLHWAAYRGDVDAVKQLIAIKADVGAKNVYGVTPLALAAETGNAAIIALLLKAGADAESVSAEGQTALMSVARTGNIEAAKLLIKHGANVNARETFGGQTALMWASARRHPEMVKLLASKRADVNARATVRNFERHITVEQRYKNTHTGGLTPLLYAVRENCKGCVDALLAAKADINLPDPDGIGALQLGMMSGNWDIAKCLVEAGADVNQWDIYGQAPLHVAIENAYVTPRSGIANTGTDRTPNETDAKSLVKMLVERGANPNQQMFFRTPREAGMVSTSQRGTTPFHRAVASLDNELIQYLLAHGAEINLNTAADESAMMLAINARGSEDQVLATLRLLHEAGANPNAMRNRIWMFRNRGGTALHDATRKGQKKVMAELVKFGADPDIKDDDGLTALDYALSRGWVAYLTNRPPPRQDLAKLLRDLGAKVELSKMPDWPGEFPPIGPPRAHESEIWPL